MVAVEAAAFLAAHVAAAVGNLTAVPLWVRHFACQPKHKYMTRRNKTEGFFCFVFLKRLVIFSLKVLHDDDD